MKSIYRFFLLALIPQVCTGCTGWWGEREAPRIPGNRISVLSEQRPPLTITGDQRLVSIPRPHRNTSWPQAGGFAHHAMHHLSAPGSLTKIWSRALGGGSSKYQQLLGSPVIFEGKIYVITADAVVTELKASNGEKGWSKKLGLLLGKGSEGTLGGGLAVSGNLLFATTGAGIVFCMDRRNGKVIWTKNIGTPIRSGPAIYDGQVIVSDITNKTYSFDKNNGSRRWQHSGILERAIFMGGSSPAASKSIVVVSHSSGELVAIGAQNGNQLWIESLVGKRKADPISNISHSRGNPIIDRNLVVASSNSGRTIATDLASGTRVWETNFGSSESPWVAGEYVYLVTTNRQLVCLVRQTGKVVWVTQLKSFENSRDKEKPIQWTGPVLAGDRVLVAGSSGEVWSLSPFDGEPLGKIRVSNALYLSPVVADEIVYFLDDNARLYAYR